jgi:general stress protein 26
MHENSDGLSIVCEAGLCGSPCGWAGTLSLLGSLGGALFREGFAMIYHFRTAVLFAVWACNIGTAQPSKPGPSERAQIIAAAREVMKQAHYGTLVTIGEDGQPQARIVDPAEPDQEFVVWLATKNMTRKVSQLRKNPRATLHYFDRATMAYVTLLGGTTLVSDQAEKDKHWQASWAPFYPEGPKTADLILIRFAPRTLEVVSVRDKLMNDPQTWRPVTVEFK